MEEVQFDKEVREKLIKGINTLAKAVGSTMGPMGRTVIIPDRDKYGRYKVTKDGVSVARSIELKDAIENIGADFIRGAAELTVELAGDGTTTATVLASALVNNLKDFNTVEINKALDEIIPEVIKQLKLGSKELKCEEIKYVASISANNDMSIGETIQSAYNHSELVKVEESNNTEDRLELINGMSLPVSYFSKNFITNEKRGECELQEPHVLIVEGKLDKLEPYRSILEMVAAKNESLLIIVSDIHEQALRKLETLCLSNNFKVCVMKSPGFSKHRKDLLQDLADFTGSSVHDDIRRPAILGKLQSCKIAKNHSVLLKHTSIDVSSKIDTLSELLKSEDYTDYDKELLTQRLNNLKGRVSVIKVGGKSELEMKERKDRYDDAVLAVACALEEGIVEGGGIAFERMKIKLHLDYPCPEDERKMLIQSAIISSIGSPMSKIIENGANVTTLTDMFERNIIDPLKVTRCALENAVAVAKIILSTDAVVLSKEEWN